MRCVLPAVLCAIAFVPASALADTKTAIAAGLLQHAHSRRTAATDLEIAGDLRGQPPDLPVTSAAKTS